LNTLFGKKNVSTWCGRLQESRIEIIGRYPIRIRCVSRSDIPTSTTQPDRLDCYIYHNIPNILIILSVLLYLRVRRWWLVVVGDSGSPRKPAAKVILHILYMYMVYHTYIHILMYKRIKDVWFMWFFVKPCSFSVGIFPSFRGFILLLYTRIPYTWK